MFKTADEAIKAAEKANEMSDNYIIFDGMNCNDYLSADGVECEGWDGESRRCECGNRRVYWATYGDNTSGFIAYAEAY